MMEADEKEFSDELTAGCAAAYQRLESEELLLHCSGKDKKMEEKKNGMQALDLDDLVQVSGGAGSQMDDMYKSRIRSQLPGICPVCGNEYSAGHYQDGTYDSSKKEMEFICTRKQKNFFVDYLGNTKTNNPSRHHRDM